MVVIVQAGFAQPLGLAILQHAERRAGLETQCLDLAHHRQHRFEVAVLGSAPRRAHAKTRRAGRPGRPRGSHHGIERKQLLADHLRVITRRLWAVTAILGTAAGLDRQQSRKLHRVRIVMRAVRLVRPAQQIVHRQAEERLDRVDAPAGLRLRVRLAALHRDRLHA